MSDGTPRSGGDTVAALWARWRANPLLPLLVGGAAVIAVVAALWMWAGAPEYRVLYSHLGEADGGRVIAELERRAVPYRIAEGGGALLVPGDQVHRLRLRLAEQGLPRGGNVGFEIMDSQAFGISQFAERVNFQRGLQGELAGSIEALGPVARARVHLSMAKPSVFIREREPAKASVVLTLEPGRALGQGQVDAIVHLVSSSVPELAAEDVTVVDQSGRLLSRPAGGDGSLDGSQLDYVRDLEQRYRQRIEDILSPILGRDRVRAQVVAQVDFSRREQTSERYGPNQNGNPVAVRSHQFNSDYRGDQALPAGVPGALSNIPPGAAPSPVQAPDDGEDTDTDGEDDDTRRLHQDGVINYEVDRDVTHTRHQRARLERLSVAVVVDHRETVNEQGETISEPLDEARLERIRELVRQAMGFSEARGDGLEVVNAPFAETSDPLTVREWWRDPFWQTLLLSLARWLLVGLATLLLFLLVLRPLFRRALEQRPAAAAALPVGEQSARQEQPRQEQSQHDQSGYQQAEPEPAPPPPRRRRRRSDGVREENLRDLQEMAREDPAMVAMIVRSWMNRDD